MANIVIKNETEFELIVSGVNTYTTKDGKITELYKYSVFDDFELEGDWAKRRFNGKPGNDISLVNTTTGLRDTNVPTTNGVAIKHGQTMLLNISGTDYKTFLIFTADGQYVGVITRITNPGAAINLNFGFASKKASINVLGKEALIFELMKRKSPQEEMIADNNDLLKIVASANLFQCFTATKNDKIATARLRTIYMHVKGAKSLMYMSPGELPATEDEREWLRGLQDAVRRVEGIAEGGTSTEDLKKTTVMWLLNPTSANFIVSKIGPTDPNIQKTIDSLQGKDDTDLSDALKPGRFHVLMPKDVADNATEKTYDVDGKTITAKFLFYTQDKNKYTIDAASIPAMISGVKMTSI